MSTSNITKQTRKPPQLLDDRFPRVIAGLLGLTAPELARASSQNVTRVYELIGTSTPAGDPSGRERTWNVSSKKLQRLERLAGPCQLTSPIRQSPPLADKAEAWVVAVGFERVDNFDADPYWPSSGGLQYRILGGPRFPLFESGTDAYLAALQLEQSIPRDSRAIELVGLPATSDYRGELLAEFLPSEADPTFISTDASLSDRLTVLSELGRALDRYRPDASWIAEDGSMVVADVKQTPQTSLAEMLLRITGALAPHHASRLRSEHDLEEIKATAERALSHDTSTPEGRLDAVKVLTGLAGVGPGAAFCFIARERPNDLPQQVRDYLDAYIHRGLRETQPWTSKVSRDLAAGNIWWSWELDTEPTSPNEDDRAPEGRAARPSDRANDTTKGGE